MYHRDAAGRHARLIAPVHALNEPGAQVVGAHGWHMDLDKALGFSPRASARAMCADSKGRIEAFPTWSDPSGFGAAAT